jgi:hypothetical protein
MPIHGYPGNVITANPTAPTVSSASGVWTTEQQLINQSAGRWPMAATQISRSLRFNSADTAYLNRTPATASNRKTWTWSAWVKRSGLSARNALFTEAQTGYSTYFSLYFETDNTIAVHGVFGGTALLRQTAAVFRDVSAWYHVVIAVDTTQATDSNRILLYVNGVNYSLPTVVAGSWPTQNSDGGVNLNQPHEIGRRAIDNDMLANFYLAEVNFIDGLALTPSYFGFNDSNTGVWTPRQYTGTYGTNGFYVNFSDNSNTTAATLGKDYSGNGNNWTPNNFSVTAGAGNDSLVDSPTSYGTDTGVGGEVRGNYATWNPIYKDAIATTTATSNGNLDTTGQFAYSTIGFPSGKFYFECTVGSNNNQFIGVSTNPYAAANLRAYNKDGTYYTGSGWIAYGATYTTNDIIGVAIDMDSQTIQFYKNGSSQGQKTSIGLSGLTIFPMLYVESSGSVTANFGQRAFAYTAPSGFKALCTQNLPTPTIGATSTTQANDYFNTILYTGTGSNLAVTGVGFQPDLLWIKQRSSTESHTVFDAVRGVDIGLTTNTTAAEVDFGVAAQLSFDSDGFTLGTNGRVNTNTSTFVAWNWKANGSGSSNTAGTITSTVSASTTSGFSIVTGTLGAAGVQGTVGHGLGVAPSMIIFKTRSGATYNWAIYHASVCDTTSKYFRFTTDALQTYSTTWGAALPTSTVFGVTGDGCGSPSNPFVAYCFAPVAGYSAFGSYTGNGSSDGPFVYTGFRPAFVLIKTTGSGASWVIFDNKRDTFNVTNKYLEPNASSAEGTFSTIDLDLLSNGLKLRGNQATINSNAATYIYACFAENPFKYSLAR